jgi:glycine betaine/proline transport system permease protein
MDIITAYKIPVGPLAKSLVDWLTANGSGAFDLIAAVLGGIVGLIMAALQALPAPITALIIAAIAYGLKRSVPLALFVAAALLFIVNQGFWKETTQTLALVITSSVVCMAVGVPVGILAARRPWLMAALRPVLDLMQTIPTLVYLIPALVLFGLGMVPGLIVTVIFALPASIRLTALGVGSTPRPLIEAADSFGATPLQRLVKVELPYAMPQIFAGLTQTIMLSLSMVVIAAMVGANGLGVPVVRALNTVNIGMGFTAGLAIVLIAIMLDRMCRVRG